MQFSHKFTIVLCFDDLLKRKARVKRLRIRRCSWRINVRTRGMHKICSRHENILWDNERLVMTTTRLQVNNSSVKKHVNVFVVFLHFSNDLSDGCRWWEHFTNPMVSREKLIIEFFSLFKYSNSIFNRIDFHPFMKLCKGMRNKSCFDVSKHKIAN